MEKRQLGRSNLELGVMGMGCWQFGGGSYWGKQSQKDVNEVVHEAIAHGINYFDTAEMYNYGESEESLGIALKNKRDQVIIGSKVTPANAYPYELRKSCESSLKRLQTDYIDLFMLHWPLNSISIKHFTDDVNKISNPPNIEEVFDTLHQLKKEGSIRHIGISNFGINQMIELENLNADYVSNQLPYNLISRAIEGDILDQCIKANIGIIGYMPLQQGLLSGKYNFISEIDPKRTSSRHFHYKRGDRGRHGENGAEQEINAALPKIREIANDLGIDMNVLSLAWVIYNKGITSLIVGSRNREQLKLNIQASEVHLPNDIVEELNKITLPILQKLGNNPDYYENSDQSRIY